jgi:glycosyltransferase involved in cell wall biosynthesis
VRKIRVLRIYHSAVVDEFRQRERMLRQRHDHDVHVVCPPAWPEGGRLVRPTTDPEVPVHIVGIAGPRRPNLFCYRHAGLRSVLRSTRPDIVDLHEEPFSLAVAGALHAIKLEAPEAKVCIYSAQNLPKRYPPPFSWLERRALTAAGAAYPCSTEAGERLVAQGFRGAVHVVPLGVTIPASMPRRPGPLRVGFVGRLEPYKGGMIAIGAFSMVVSDCVDATMDVVGAGSEEEAMRREVERAGLQGCVAFTGALSQDETLARIADMDVVMVPSLTMPGWKEQFGRVAAQAMAAGAVVVASDSGSLREVVGDCGVLVPEGDISAFADALRSLAQEPALLADLAERARIRARERFSWESVADRVDEMYCKLMEH